MRDPEVKTLIKFLSNKYGLTQEHMEEILDSPFEFLANVLKTKADSSKLIFPSVRIPFFGFFSFPPGSRKGLEKIRERYLKEHNGTPRISEQDSTDIQELSS
jgi:hypothetical protein